VKFEVYYYHFNSVAKEPERKTLAILSDLFDACHVAVALRAARANKLPGSIMIMGRAKGRHGHIHGVGMALDCTGDCKVTVTRLYEKASDDHKEAMQRRRSSERRYSWLKAKTGDEFFAQALAALCKHNPIYDARLGEASQRDDFTEAEVRLAHLGYLAHSGSEVAA